VAREKDLRLRVLPSRAWVSSDFILLERILLNLVSNAVRYTAQGGVVVGCRSRAGFLRLDVWDSGTGIPDDQRGKIFNEFYQLDTGEPGRHGGLGLGLAIVDRLCRLLDHPIDLVSRLGNGSRFSVLVPLADPQMLPQDAQQIAADQPAGKLVVVIDDDMLVLDAMEGILKTWGCRVVSAGSDEAALAGLAKYERPPDLIISDYRLRNGKTGFEVIDCLRRAFGAPIPAFLISGDTAPERLREAGASGYYLLHKPVLPVTLRSVVNHLLKEHNGRTDTTLSPDPTTDRQSAAIASPVSLPQ